MTKILIGSKATRMWFTGAREADDIDYFTPDNVYGYEKIDTFWHENIERNLDLLAHYCLNGNVGEKEWIAKPDFLYTLKVSHIFWNNNTGSWRKHANDIHWFQERTGAKFVPDIYNVFYPIWEQRYGKKKVNLELSPKDFFNNNVSRTYDHDSIHASVAYYEKPLFTEILRDGHEVAVDMQKFNNLPIEKKYQLVREECYATALERQIIPSEYTYSPRAAYSWALMKTLTSFWKGDWALFVALNYNKLYKPDVDYVKRHHENKDRLILL